MEILKQNQYAPLPVEKQIIVIFAATNGYVDGYSPSDLGRYEQELYAFLDSRHADLLRQLAEKKVLDAAIKTKVASALEEFKVQFVPSAQKAAAGA